MQTRLPTYITQLWRWLRNSTTRSFPDWLPSVPGTVDTPLSMNPACACMTSGEAACRPFAYGGTSHRKPSPGSGLSHFGVSASRWENTVVVKRLNHVLHFCNPAIRHANFRFAWALRSRRHPDSTVFLLHPSALRSFLQRRFDVFQNCRPPTTPLDSAPREQSNGVIAEFLRCPVAKLLRIKYCTSRGGSIWYKLVPVQVDECPGGRCTRIQFAPKWLLLP